MAFERANPRLDQATIHFQLRFTRTAQSDAATALTLPMRPTTDQTGRDVLQLREFDLQLAFGRTRARRENVTNPAGAPGGRARPERCLPGTPEPKSTPLTHRTYGAARKPSSAWTTETNTKT